MNRNIDYIIDEDSSGLRVEQFLRRKRYSGQNLSEIKKNAEKYPCKWGYIIICVRNFLQETICKCGSVRHKNSEKIPPTKLPLDIIYEDEDLLVLTSLPACRFTRL